MRSNVAATLAVFAIAPLVEALTTSGSLETSYVTEYYDDCPSSNATATGTVTSTYCSSCTTKKPSGFGNTTIARITTLTTYTTAYLDVCPTGTIFQDLHHHRALQQPQSASSDQLRPSRICHNHDRLPHLRRDSYSYRAHNPCFYQSWTRWSAGWKSCQGHW